MYASARTLPPRYDPLSRAVLDNPYQVYARLRQAGPLCRGGVGQWVVTRHEDVARLLGARALGSEQPDAYRTFALGAGATNSFYERIVLYRDPPMHSHLRALLRRAVTPPRLEALVARLPALLDELMQPALDGAPFDLVRDLAFPLSLRVMCEIIGFPVARAKELRRPALDLSKAFGTQISESDRAAAAAAVDELRRHAGALLEESRQAEGDDVLTQMANPGAPVTWEDCVDNIAFLLFAGFETTGNMVSNGIAALLENPDELARLRLHPELAGSAADELLRYDTPIQGVARFVREPIVVGGRVIKAGRVLILLLASANRDPARFPEPDRLDISRRPNPHLSFGGGVHHCLGASLARIEISAALSSLCARTRSVTPSQPVRRTDTRFRGYASLPVEMRAA